MSDEGIKKYLWVGSAFFLSVCITSEVFTALFP